MYIWISKEPFCDPCFHPRKCITPWLEKLLLLWTRQRIYKRTDLDGRKRRLPGWLALFEFMETCTCVLLKSSGFSVIYDEGVSQENALTLEAAKVIGTKIFHPAKRSCRNFTCFLFGIRWVFCHLRRRRNAPSCKSHTRQEKPSLPLFVFSQALPSACRCPEVKSRKGVSTLQVLWIPLQTGVLRVKHVYTLRESSCWIKTRKPTCLALVSICCKAWLTSSQQTDWISSIYDSHTCYCMYATAKSIPLE